MSGNRIVGVLLAAVFLGLSFVCGLASSAARKHSAAAKPAMAADRNADRNIVQNLSRSPDFSTLLAAIRESGLAPTLESRGSFTLFAPTNEAFDSLPAGAIDDLMEPRHRAMLEKILKYHVVPGRVTARDMREMVTKGHGVAKLKTLEGGDLRIAFHGGRILLIDQKGGQAAIVTPDVSQSNGMMQGIDAVLIPR